MSPSEKAMATAVLVVLVIGGAFGIYYLNTSSTLASQEQTISGLQSTVSSLTSHPITSTTTSTSTQTETETTTSLTTTRTIITITTTQFPNVPWPSVQFMAPPSDGGCNGFCWDSNLSDAVLFDCANATATQGCTEQFTNNMTQISYSITAWYPQVNQPNEQPPDNCAYSVVELPTGEPLPGGFPGFAYCIAIGSSAFVLAEQGVVPTR